MIFFFQNPEEEREIFRSSTRSGLPVRARGQRTEQSKVPLLRDTGTNALPRTWAGGPQELQKADLKGDQNPRQTFKLQNTYYGASTSRAVGYVCSEHGECFERWRVFYWKESFMETYAVLFDHPSLVKHLWQFIIPVGFFLRNGGLILHLKMKYCSSQCCDQTKPENRRSPQHRQKARWTRPGTLFLVNALSQLK